MRFRVIGPHAILGHDPGEEFEYEAGAPAWEDHEEGAPPAYGAPFKWSAWVRSGWVEVIDGDAAASTEPAPVGAPARAVGTDESEALTP